MINWGGMGVVWRAEDVLIGREVAVKELRAPVGVSKPQWQEFTERALREARSTGRITHPGVAGIFDVVLDDGAAYLIMELLDGLDLAQVIEQEGPLDESRVVDIASQVLDALAAAHAEDVVHRDVKPGNIMVLPDGTVKLIDFGIAHALGETRMTVNAVIGTRAYMAPELFANGEITAAADMWSLGVTLYAAVSGESPFLRDSEAATLSALLFDPIPPPRCKSPLKETITALLTREPDKRATLGGALGLLAGRQLKATAKLSTTPEVAKPEVSAPAVAKPRLPVGSAPVGTPGGKPPSRQAGGWTVVVVVVLLVLVGVPEVRDKVGDFFDRGSAKTGTGVSTLPTAQSTPTGRYPLSQPDTRDRITTTTRTTTTTTTTDPGSPDSVARDKTPFTANALMPDSYIDSKDVKYKVAAGGVHDCVQRGMSQNVRDILSRAGCARMVTGSFVDSSGKILVSVQVYAFENTAAADAVYGRFDAASSLSFGLWCPLDGTGAAACKGDDRKATRSIYIGHHHRYVFSAYALYINLTSEAGAKPWLDAAAKRAVNVVGPQNYR
nr:serine/threonine-protein kinase [Kibdelosporangium phytohabitans]